MKHQQRVRRSRITSEVEFEPGPSPPTSLESKKDDAEVISLEQEESERNKTRIVEETNFVPNDNEVEVMEVREW